MGSKSHIRSLVVAAGLFFSCSAFAQYFGTTPSGVSDMGSSSFAGTQGAVGLKKGEVVFVNFFAGIVFQQATNFAGESAIFPTGIPVRDGFAFGLHPRLSVGVSLLADFSLHFPKAKLDVGAASPGYVLAQIFGGEVYATVTLFQSKHWALAWIPRLYFGGVDSLAPVSRSLAFFDGIELVRLALSRFFANGATLNINLSALFDTEGRALFDTYVSHQLRFATGGYVPFWKSVSKEYQLGAMASVSGAVGLTTAESAPNRFGLIQGALGLRWILTSDGVLKDNVNVDVYGQTGRNPFDGGVWGGLFAAIRWSMNFASDNQGGATAPKVTPSPAVQPVQPVAQPAVVLPPDGDQDGIVDANDACPAQPGVAKYKGCPVPDTDGDGMDDEQDQCMYDPGTKEQAGCAKRELIEVKQDQIETKAGVVYVLPRKNKRKEWLTPAGKKLLAELSDVLTKRSALTMNLVMEVGKRGPMKETVQTRQQAQVMQRMEAGLCKPLAEAYAGRVTCGAKVVVLPKAVKGQKPPLPYEKLVISIVSK